MEYQHTEWRVSELIENVRSGTLELNPEYQRNPVWRSSSQTKLIESILSGRPIPSFFVRELGDGKMEMVDGQQRARTIIGYFENKIPDHNRRYFEQAAVAEVNHEKFKKSFFEYRISITVISNLSGDEKIEDYYALLNSTGLRLNRPELKKAEYYGTRFLHLVKSATDYPPFRDLDLFDQHSISRMTDFEMASEILAQFKFGPTDKKEKIDLLYEDDISFEEEAHLMEAFCVVFDILSKLDQVLRVKRTRLRQKADLYSYSYFIHSVARIPYSTHLHFYQVFLKIAPHIRPSNTECEPLREYAHNCVTQSNSKKARETRFQILTDIIANPTKTPTERQLQVLDFFELTVANLIEVDGFLTLRFSDLRDPKQTEMSFSEFLDDAL